MQFRLDIKKRLFGAYAVVLLLGAALASLVFLAGERVVATSQQLVERDLASLTAIAALRLDIREQEALLYRYFVDRDRSRFAGQHAAAHQACRAGLDRIAAATESGAAALEADYGRLRQAGEALDRAVRARPVAEGAARRALAEASAAARRIAGELDMHATTAVARLDRSAQHARETAQSMQTVLVLFTGAILLVSLLVGRVINAYINAQAERQRLTLFPERNPNPVLRLGPDGRIDYANPTSGQLARTLADGAADLRLLLPDDLDARLTEFRQSAAQRAHWEYAVGDRRTLECDVHWLADLGCFHAYVTDISERKRAEGQLVHQAYHDALTGLPNRRMFEEQLEHRLYAERRGGTRAAYLLLGVDRFRVVIESFGPTAGDTLLQALARRLRELLQQEEDAAEAVLYRMDGDRFAVFLPGFAASQAPMRLAEHLLAGLHAPFYALGREYHLSVSIGISIYPLDGQDAQTLERNAETAMQRVKQQGGASFECYTREMNERAAEWLGLENQLRHAEKLGELRLHYQPQLEVASGRLVGAEALIRWQHPERGLLAPSQFMPLAEESGLIIEIGDWVLRTACAQAAAWRRAGLDGLAVAVNLSARQFAQPQLPARVAELLREAGLPPAQFELEITENVAMHDIGRAIATLQQLRAIGAKLSVDDFGTGFSSLSYLKRFPIDKLKIDQSFVRHLPHDDNDAAITRAVIALGNSLRLRVIAEGVETAEQLAWLRASGCHEYQGYHYSRPLPPEEFIARIATDRADLSRVARS